MSDNRLGAICGLAAAALFGVAAPISKRLLPETSPIVLAGLLYLGAALGLLLVRRSSAEASLKKADLPLLGTITLLGGVVAPVLMLTGLSRTSGVAGSLLLNLEAPFTILLALLVFREHLGRRELLAASAIVAGAGILAWRPGELRADLPGVAAIAGACLCWAIDNNLSQRLSVRDPVRLVRAKALGAGVCNLAVALALGHSIPAATVVVPALLLGMLSYGASIVLDTYALRLIGAAREAAFFATAPFVGAAAALPILGESLDGAEILAGACMIAGVFMLLRERHGHTHVHDPLEHEHLHVHDAHHQHVHEGPVTEPHSHPHRHERLVHDHPHVSDVHHRHEHS